MGKFEEIYLKHVQSVFRYALRCAGRRDVAEDLTSDAFLALYRNLYGIDESLLPGWLLTVVRNRARDLWRRDAVEKRYAKELACRPMTEAPQLEDWILQCADLKSVHRTCLALRYVYGLNRAEIAVKTGLNEMQVKNCLQYGLELLRRAYKTYEKEVHGDPAA
jgi:RNA polymerase sigma-70 factor (ECF subfamily)